MSDDFTRSNSYQMIIRMLDGETVRIGALGGSITKGSAADPNQDYM